MHHTDHRAGDPPKPPFPIESIENQQKSNNQCQNSRKKKPLFTSLRFVWAFVFIFKQNMQHGSSPTRKKSSQGLPKASGVF